MDDLRLGRIARALRHRLGIPQRETGARAKTSQDAVSRLERGRIEGMTVGHLRSILAVYDAELIHFVRWRGGEVDRLLDRSHAELGEMAVRLLVPLGWEVVAEVSYSIYGERGSIDLMAWHARARVLLVIEIKSELTSVEETLRRHDAKVRLAPGIARERFGWDVGYVARLLVLPDVRTPRRHVERHAGLFGGAYPLRGWALKRWLGDPLSAAAKGGVLFLSTNDDVRSGHGPHGRKRIRNPRCAPKPVSEAPDHRDMLPITHHAGELP